ncbi:hypothetical protein [Micromonospora sp. CB01531]|uniref:hypothetical protein n=1 Tax=Micromonospora sp. CB01531 TaxID=1718947 RepID=UPI00093922C9|nr:hypothetical protein [Micromonospora sp. CB01531]OKI45097.1 hypothetical protein A6A27_11805 [Micromonospora sp. CB01531]
MLTWTADEAMDALVNAADATVAEDICGKLPPRTLRELCDLMYLPTTGNRVTLTRRVMGEVRA